MTWSLIPSSVDILKSLFDSGPSPTMTNFMFFSYITICFAAAKRYAMPFSLLNRPIDPINLSPSFTPNSFLNVSLSALGSYLSKSSALCTTEILSLFILLLINSLRMASDTAIIRSNRLRIILSSASYILSFPDVGVNP